ncbi:hypothetical protein TNCV_2988831 [Trichonephila clavipes]|nr:hypothetical protein TNCV_2988831 [Trichonephila clavipes]
MGSDAASSESFFKYVCKESLDCPISHIECSFLNKSSNNIGSVKYSVTDESYQEFNNYLECSVCKIVVVRNSILESTEKEHSVDKVTKVEFDDVVNEQGNIYIFCPECWMVIGHCDEKHENKKFYTHLVNFVSKVKKSFRILKFNITA